jgi:DNA-binding NtrC family response regulator
MPTFLSEQLHQKPRHLTPVGFSAVESESIRRLIGHSVAEVEGELIRKTLAHFCGNRTRAARVLGVSIRTLRNKIQEYKTNGSMGPDIGATAAQANK